MEENTGYWELCQNENICSNVHLGIFNSRKTRTKPWVQTTDLTVVKRNLCWVTQNMKGRKKETWQKTGKWEMWDDRNSGEWSGLAEGGGRRESQNPAEQGMVKSANSLSVQVGENEDYAQNDLFYPDLGHGMLREEAGLWNASLKGGGGGVGNTL